MYNIEPAPTDPPTPKIPESPRNLTVDPLTTSVTVSWDVPIDNGAVITGYKLAYGTSDNPTANTVTVDPSPTQTVLEGLASNSQYRVSVVAYSTEGESRPVSIAFQTAEGKQKFKKAIITSFTINRRLCLFTSVDFFKGSVFTS